MKSIIIGAGNLDGYFTPDDEKSLDLLKEAHNSAMETGSSFAVDKLIDACQKTEALTKKICEKEPAINVYSFTANDTNKNEASRIISKLRSVDTKNEEFIFYIQKAYELLFKQTYLHKPEVKIKKTIIKTPVTVPVQNYAVHELADADGVTCNVVMCVLLRGALLPSMIVSKQIEDYSATGRVTPFALFKIRRADSKNENDMEYILDPDQSFFNPRQLDGKDLVFADPMNATCGSFITVVKYLLDTGIRPNSVNFLNVISSVKGALRAVRAIENCSLYTMWMDPALNEKAYIVPGLGDAGDRINGKDDTDNPRDIPNLLSGYGPFLTELYKNQIEEILKTVNGCSGDKR